MFIGTTKSGVKPFRTYSLLDWRLTKTEMGTTFRALPAAGAGFVVLASSSALDIGGAGAVAARTLLLHGSVAVPDSGVAAATFGFGTKSCGLAISAGRISSCAIITRVPRFVRCQSRMAKSFVTRMQPCEAGYPGTTPACNAIPDQVMRCM